MNAPILRDSVSSLGIVSASESQGAKSSATARVEVCGLRFDNLTIDEALRRIDAMIRSRRAAYVVTPNVDHVVRAHRDPSYRSVVDRADLVLADGQPIVWVSRLIGRSLKQRVAGSDLFPQLCAQAAAMGHRVFFVGGAPGAAEAARQVLSKQHPQLCVVGVYCPIYGFEKNRAQQQAAVDAVCAARPDIVFVGLGSPKQERFIVDHLHLFGSAVCIGVGISFSFVAGHVRRAPRWMQRSGLEWLHRLMHEPGRLWRRYLIQSWLFLPLMLRAFWTARFMTRGSCERNSA